MRATIEPWLDEPVDPAAAEAARRWAQDRRPRLGTAGGNRERRCRRASEATEVGPPPVTEERIVRDLRGLGVEPGQTLLVNASLSSLGWVRGGAPAVVAALREAVGPAGTS